MIPTIVLALLLTVTPPASAPVRTPSQSRAVTVDGTVNLSPADRYISFFLVVLLVLIVVLLMSIRSHLERLVAVMPKDLPPPEGG